MNGVATTRHPIRRVFGFLGGFVVLFFLAVFALTLFGGESSGLLRGSGPRIALVPLRGEITRSDEFVETLSELEKDDSIASVVVRIESPGGAVAPSQEMYAAIRRLRDKKPVVASLGSVAASGGYYVACAADVVVANPGSLTGSIGVVMSLANLEGLLEKLGVQPEIVTAGAQKDMGSPFRALTPEERKLFQQMADEVHEQFLSAVAEGRGLSADELKKVSSGRVFTGEEARDLRLVDQLGGLHDAVLIAADRSGIEGEPRIETIMPRRGPWWWRFVVSDDALSPTDALSSKALVEALAALAAGAPRDGAPLLLWRLPSITEGFRW